MWSVLLAPGEHLLLFLKCWVGNSFVRPPVNSSGICKSGEGQTGTHKPTSPRILQALHHQLPATSLADGGNQDWHQCVEMHALDMAILLYHRLCTVPARKYSWFISAVHSA